MKIQTVSDYNREAHGRYQGAVKRWEPGKGGFPFIGFYQFRTDRGEERKTGWIASEKNASVWGKTKKEAIQKLKKVV